MNLPGSEENLRSRYRRQNPECELSSWLATQCPTLIHGTPAWQPTHTHHIFHLGGRLDVWSNLITVSAAQHPVWMHETCGIDARVLCLFIKLQKGELDLNELNRAAGAVRPDAQPVLAWLTRAVPEPEWAQRMLRELVKALSLRFDCTVLAADLDSQ